MEHCLNHAMHFTGTLLQDHIVSWPRVIISQCLPAYQVTPWLKHELAVITIKGKRKWMKSCLSNSQRSVQSYCNNINVWFRNSILHLHYALGYQECVRLGEQLSFRGLGVERYLENLSQPPLRANTLSQVRRLMDRVNKANTVESLLHGPNTANIFLVIFINSALSAVHAGHELLANAGHRQTQRIGQADRRTAAATMQP